MREGVTTDEGAREGGGGGDDRVGEAHPTLSVAKLAEYMSGDIDTLVS